MGLFGKGKGGGADGLLAGAEMGMRKRGVSKRRAYMTIGVVIAVVLVYYVYFLAVNQTVVHAPATVNITTHGTLFSINSNQYFISLASTSAANGKAYVLVSTLPVLTNPVLNVTLSLDNITKVNAGSQWSDMGIMMQSMGRNSITVQVSPLYTTLQIASSSSDIRVVNSTLYKYGTGGTAPTGGSGGASTSTTTTTVGTSASTTSIKAANTTAIAINTILQQNGMYALLLNYSVLYANTTNCTLTKYNTAYIKYMHSNPKPPNDYDNASSMTPYAMVSSTAGSGSSYYVNFTTKSRSSFFDGKTAVSFNADTSSGTAKYTISSSGIFEGQTYAGMLSNYNAAKLEGACGVEI